MAAIEAIATTYLEANAASVTFSSLGSYEHLQLRHNARTENAAGFGRILLQFNGDTGSNYSEHYMRGYSTTVDAGGTAGATYINIPRLSGATNPATQYGSGIVDILDYRNTSKNTTTLTTAGIASSGYSEAIFYSGLWDSTAAVTSLLLTPGSGDFMRGSEFTLYGLNSS